MSINSQYIVARKGVTPGECYSLGSVNLNLDGLNCEVHVMPDDFPTDTDGLGWPIFDENGGKMNAAGRCLRI